MIGWQCPGCSRCYAPSVAACGHCGPGMTTGLTTGTVTIFGCQHETDPFSARCIKCGEAANQPNAFVGFNYTVAQEAQ